jgi:hypothetical protein
VPLHLDTERPAGAGVGPRRRLVALLALVMSVAAVGGSIGLVSGMIDMGNTIEHRLPLDSPAFGGAALTVVVAVPMAVTAWRTWRRHPRAARTAELAAVMLVAWIGVQLLVIRQFSFLQPVCVAVGLAILVLGWEDGVHRHPA